MGVGPWKALAIDCLFSVGERGSPSGPGLVVETALALKKDERKKTR